MLGLFNSIRRYAIVAFVGGALLGAPCLTLAQDAKAFALARKSKGAGEIFSSHQLNTFVGTKVVQVRVLISGVCLTDDTSLLMAETEDGFAIEVAAPSFPEWVKTGGAQARMLVKIDRPSEYSALRASYVLAIPEDLITRYDKANAPKSKSSASRPKATNTTSRSISRRPPPMRGSIPSQRTGSWSLSADQAIPHYAAFAKSKNKRLTDEEAYEIARSVIAFSLEYKVDARLIMSVILVESTFNPRSVSHVGAVGLGQLMPDTARELGVTDRHNMSENVYGMVKLISQHLAKYQSKTGDPEDALVLSLAAYNAGAGAVRKHGGVPPYRETQNYVNKVISTYRALCGN